MKTLIGVSLLISFLQAQIPAVAQEKRKADPHPRKVPPPPEDTRQPVELYRYRQVDSAALHQSIKFQKDTATPPADALTAEIRKHLALTNVLDMSRQFSNLLVRRDQLDPQGELPDEFFIRFENSYRNGKAKTLFENSMINLYRQHFTLDEFTTLNLFYETSLGKKVISTMPLLLSEAYQRGEQLGSVIGKEIAEQLIREGIIKEK